MKLCSISLESVFDDCGDSSYLGEYSNKWVENAIDRKRFGHWQRGEYLYFVSAIDWWNAKGTKKRELFDQALEDMDRLENYGKTWWHIRIYASANIIIQGVYQEISSGSLGSIETGHTEDDFTEIKKELLGELSNILKEIGFSEEQISSVEVKDNV